MSGCLNMGDYPSEELDQRREKLSEPPLLILQRLEKPSRTSEAIKKRPLVHFPNLENR